MSGPDSKTIPDWCLRHRSKFVALFFAVVTAWILQPVWGELGTSLIGDPRTDAIRGMWGLDHLRHALLEGHPFQTQRVNFPSGAYAVVLPLGTGTKCKHSQLRRLWILLQVEHVALGHTQGRQCRGGIPDGTLVMYPTAVKGPALPNASPNSR